MRRPLALRVQVPLVTSRNHRYNCLNKMAAKPGLYANIAAKRRRIEAGSEESMRKPGTKGAPSAADFRKAAKTAKKKKK